MRFAFCRGGADDPESAVSRKYAELKDRGYREFALPAWERTRPEVVYLTEGR